MTTITIEVPDDIADKYNRASREEQKTLRRYSVPTQSMTSKKTCRTCKNS